jgi:hypothetical protein
MKFADDEYLTPFGIWLKRRLIMLGNYARMIYEDFKTGGAPPQSSKNESKDSSDRQKLLGVRDLPR